MKIICDVFTSQGILPRVLAATSNDPAVVANTVKQRPGVGKPAYVAADNTLPGGTLSSVIYDQAFIVNADAAINKAAIEAMLQTVPPFPELLTWA